MLCACGFQCLKPGVGGICMMMLVKLIPMFEQINVEIPYHCS